MSTNAKRGIMGAENGSTPERKLEQAETRPLKQDPESEHTLAYRQRVDHPRQTGGPLPVAEDFQKTLEDLRVRRHELALEDPNFKFGFGESLGDSAGETQDPPTMP